MEFKNSLQLSEFCKQNGLQRQNGNHIFFNAIVSIVTANNNITDETMDVWIIFDNHTNVIKLDWNGKSNIDPYIYPTEFQTKFQEIECVKGRLKITGHHTQNANIGKYSVEIIPINN